ncbi:GNAT family N-acetyltransferase [Fredinandcohnia humi]
MIQDFTTERLHVRKMTASDATELFKIWSDPVVTQFMNIENMTEEKQAIDIINYLGNLADENKAIRYSIIERNTNKIIGSCGYNSLDFENSKCEIGYEIAHQYWGKGYASEAISMLLENAFNNLNLNRVEAKVEIDNVASVKVLQKLNFTYEGTLRQTEKSKGRFIDLQIFSKLQSD